MLIRIRIIYSLGNTVHICRNRPLSALDPTPVSAPMIDGSRIPLSRESACFRKKAGWWGSLPSLKDFPRDMYPCLFVGTKLLQEPVCPSRTLSFTQSVKLGQFLDLFCQLDSAKPLQEPVCPSRTLPLTESLKLGQFLDIFCQLYEPVCPSRTLSLTQSLKLG